MDSLLHSFFITYRYMRANVAVLHLRYYILKVITEKNVSIIKFQKN